MGQTTSGTMARKATLLPVMSEEDDRQIAHWLIEINGASAALEIASEIAASIRDGTRARRWRMIEEQILAQRNLREG